MKTQIRSQTLDLPAPMREHARVRVREALQRFADRVESVVVRIDDLNGPRGGVDKSCRLAVRGPKLSLIVEHRHADPQEALTRALRRIARTLARRIDADRGRPARALPAGGAA